MKIFLLVIFAIFAAAQAGNCGGNRAENANKTVVAKPMNAETKSDTKFDRLPDGVQLSDEVRKDVTNDKGEVVSTKTTTVEAELKELDAKYAGDKLVDRNGKEIHFYTPPVRGVSQGFEEDQRQRKEAEKNLADLKKKYTVIILYVDPRKVS